MNSGLRAVLSAAGAAGLLAGCAAGPDYRAPAAAALGVPAAYTGPEASAAEADLARWWGAFDDPLLTELVTQAAAGNLDVAQSVARLRQAREARVQARAAQLPTLSGSFGITRNAAQGTASSAALAGLTAGDYTDLSAGLSASWQGDLFGGLRRATEAARASEAAAAFDLEGVRTSVAAEVATNYVDARLAQARLAIARDTLRTQDDNLHIAGWRAQAGLVSALDEEQARVQRAQTSASIPLLQTSFVNAVNRLAVLTGVAPGTLTARLSAPGPIPRAADAVAAGIPADTLRRRPDVRAAERRLAAATAEIGVAKAQLYPALSLTGSLNTSAGKVSGLGDLVTGAAFAGLTQTLFDAGRNRSQVRSARAGADLALAAYKGTVLGGLEEVENALQSIAAARSRRSDLLVAQGAAETAAVYARSQYSSGLTDFLTLLQSEQALLSARDAAASAEADRSLALIRLYLALGGGWTPQRLSAGGPAR